MDEVGAPARSPGCARCEYCGERIAGDEDARSDGWGLRCEACAKPERTRP